MLVAWPAGPASVCHGPLLTAERVQPVAAHRPAWAGPIKRWRPWVARVCIQSSISQLCASWVSVSLSVEWDKDRTNLRGPSEGGARLSTVPSLLVVVITAALACGRVPGSPFCKDGGSVEN